MWLSQPNGLLQGLSGPAARCWPLRGQRLIFKDTSVLHYSNCVILLSLSGFCFNYVVFIVLLSQPNGSLQGPSGPVARCWPLRGQRLIFKDTLVLHYSDCVGLAIVLLFSHRDLRILAVLGILSFVSLQDCAWRAPPRNKIA